MTYQQTAAPARQRVGAAAVKQSGRKPDAPKLPLLGYESQDYEEVGPYQEPIYSEATTRALARRIAERKAMEELMVSNYSLGGDPI